MPSPSAEPLVTVVVPAYNAERTLTETVLSVRSQTYRKLEILVVDDGSKDGTAEIVLQHMKEDPRVRLIRQTNGGVCAARNRGIAEAAGEFVALVDADDLWRPTKIEQQLAAFARGGPRAGLAYTQFVLINEDGRIIGESPVTRPEGDVLREICSRNIVGHGSSAMIHRSVFDHVGVFDLTLTQGCEDHQMYFRIAEHYDFVVVQEPLVGYRLHATSWSSSADRMLKTSELLALEMLSKHPEFRAEIQLGRRNLKLWMLRLAVRNRRYSDALRVGLDLTFRAPLFMISDVYGRAASKAFEGLRRRLFSRSPHGAQMEAPASFL